MRPSDNFDKLRLRENENRRLLTIKTVKKAMEVDQGQSSDYSVPNPSAQYYKQCNPGLNMEEIIKRVEKAIDMSSKSNEVIHAILLIQYESGARISEVLNIRGVDISGNRMIVLRGSKGSGDRTVSVNSNWAFWSKMKGMHMLVFQGFTRFYVYREYKKLGISFKFAGKGKKSVTHSLRHIMGRSLQENKVNKKLIQKQLGHESEKSTDSYMDEE